MKLMMSLINKVLPSCEQVSHLSSKSLDEKLTGWERFGLRLHLSLCELCRRSTEQMKLIRLISRKSDSEAPSQTKLSAEAKQRLLKLLKPGDHR